MDKPLETDSADAVDTSSEGEGDVQGQNTDPENQEVASLSLGEINTILGREHTSKEEALKQIQNLNSRVGDQKIAELYKKLEDKAESNDDYSDTNDDGEVGLLKKELNELRMENKVSRLVADNPEVKGYEDVISAAANQAGMDPEAWYATSKLKSDLSKSHSEPLGSTAVNQNNRVGVSTNQYQKAAKQALESPSSASQDNLVAEMLRKNKDL